MMSSYVPRGMKLCSKLGCGGQVFLLSRRPQALIARRERGAQEMALEELLGCRVELQAVLRLGEAVALVGEEQVFDVLALLAQGLHDHLALGLLDARVV